MTTNESFTADLRERITTYFNREELKALCQDLGVNYDALPGGGFFAEVGDLILMLARHGRLPDLLDALRTHRPRVEWPLIPQDYRPPAALPVSSDPAPPPASSVFNIGSVSGENVVVGNDADVTITAGRRPPDE